LSQHISEAFVEIHPSDAEDLNLGDADIATVSSLNGEMQARVVVTKRQQPGSLFIPMHFTDRFTSAGRVDSLVHAVVDPISGQPASKSTPVNAAKYDASWYGFAVILNDDFEAMTIPNSAGYWAKSRIKNGIRLELAGIEAPSDWQQFTEVLLGDVDGLLAGRPGGDMPDKGAIICSCMNVGINDIRTAIEGGCGSVDAIGEVTTAGTNCGSCQSEIRNILKELSLVAAE